MSRHYLSVRSIERVVPLGDRPGQDGEGHVPAAISDYLFDPPATGNRDQGDVGGSSALATYAILDAAKVDNLLEIMDGSDVVRECLFKGSARDDLGHVAPWIVQLEGGSRFTRSLFVHDPDNAVPWHLFSREPGIFLRSDRTLAELRDHFRKYTKAQDENGKWFYVRFWEPRWTRQLLEAMSAEDRMQFLAPLDRIITVLASGACEVLQTGEAVDENA